MLNKHNVRITASERKYMNSLKQSINRSIKNIEKTLEPYKKDTYLKRKSSTKFTPVVKKTTVNTFTTREEFLKEVEHLTKLKASLSIYKPRKPKEYKELPKRLQNRIDIEQRKHGRERLKRTKQTVKSNKKLVNVTTKLLNIPFIDRRNAQYRMNMVSSFIKVLPKDIAVELGAMTNGLTEQQFMQFFIEFGPEVINFSYNERDDDKKVAMLKEALQRFYV